jgi:hypothetical protein
MAISALHVVPALAEESAYCRKVRAHASADAALFSAPRLFVDGIRFPSSQRLDLGPTVGKNLQARIGASYSPLDLYRAMRLATLSEADCEHHESAEDIALVLADAVDFGRIPARRQQVAYLDAHRNEWVTLLAKASDGLKVGAITAMEFHELRRLTQVLERKSETARGEAERLEARAAKHVSVNWDMLAEQYAERANKLEREVLRLRALDPWGVKLSGGVIPLPDQPVDWFALVEVSYNLGGIFRDRQEDLALLARSDEVKHARYELPSRLGEMSKEVQVEIERASRELGVVQNELAFIQKTRGALDGADAPNVVHARATLAIEQYSIESDVVYLQTLVASLSTLAKVPHDS